RLHGRLGAAHTSAGRYGEAQRNWRAAVAWYRKNGDLAAQARSLSELARVQEYAGRPEDSLRTCREAVEGARRAQDTRLQAALHLRLADTLERLGDPRPPPCTGAWRSGCWEMRHRRTVRLRNRRPEPTKAQKLRQSLMQKKARQRENLH